MRFVSASSLLALLMLAHCGGAPPPAERGRLQNLGERHALDVISSELDGEGVRIETGWTVDVDTAQNLAVDFHVVGTRWGVVYVTDRVRAEYGAALPPTHDENLVILPGAHEDSDANLLILDDRLYRYSPSTDRVQAGSLGANEAEDRLRRDVRDFIAHLRNEGVL